MKRMRRFVGTSLAILLLGAGACSSPSSSGHPGGAAGTTGAAGNPGPGAAGSGGAGAGAAGTTGAAGSGAAGAAGTTGAAGTPPEQDSGAPAAGTSGAAGAPQDASAPETSTEAGVTIQAFPATQTVKMMVVGSSNELGTCWRAYLWDQLHKNGIMNFDFVGQQNEGPSCTVVGWNDKQLQAMNGMIITGVPASTYLGWFMANPPDVILMHFGGADILADKPIDGVMASYALALEQARKVNPHVVLLIAQHTPEGKDAIVPLNAAIAAWAPTVSTSASPVVVVDLYTGMVASDFSDGVHLNQAGSIKVADRWYKALVPFFKP
jgi:hypothetical protein